jgi:hypothetical protein
MQRKMYLQRRKQELASATPTSHHARLPLQATESNFERGAGTLNPLAGYFFSTSDPNTEPSKMRGHSTSLTREASDGDPESFLRFPPNLPCATQCNVSTMCREEVDTKTSIISHVMDIMVGREINHPTRTGPSRLSQDWT